MGLLAGPLLNNPATPAHPPVQGPRLYVGGVPDEISEEQIVEHFNKWGNVVDVYFPGKKGAKRVGVSRADPFRAMPVSNVCRPDCCKVTACRLWFRMMPPLWGAKGAC